MSRCFLGDEIITDNIKLLERHFGLETFLRASATRAVSSITTVGLIGNDDKLQEYVQRPNKKYAKKMMQIHKFPVASMSKERLLEKLQLLNAGKMYLKYKMLRFIYEPFLMLRTL